MAKKNRECLTCGTQYSYCPSCNRNGPYWMAEFHTENCKNIFQICTQHNVGSLTKEDAHEALKSCDLTNKENFRECIKLDLENIFFEEPKKKSKKFEPVIDDVIVPVVEESHEVVTIENDKAL